MPEPAQMVSGEGRSSLACIPPLGCNFNPVLNSRQSDLLYLTNSPRQGIYGGVKQRDFSVGSSLWKATADSAQQAKGHQCNTAIDNHLGENLPQRKKENLWKCIYGKKQAFIRTAVQLHQPSGWDVPLWPGSCGNLLGWRARLKSPSHSANQWCQTAVTKWNNASSRQGVQKLSSTCAKENILSAADSNIRVSL